MNNLYVVPFFGIGRRVTLDVCFRLRPFIGDREDVKVIEYDSVWQKSPFEELPEMMCEWSTVMLSRLKDLDGMGYRLAGAAPGFTMRELIHELESVVWLVDCGYGEREAAVRVFLELLALCHQNSC